MDTIEAKQNAEMGTEADTNANNEEESRATDVRLMKHGSPAVFTDSNDSPKNKELEIKKENTKETDK